MWAREHSHSIVFETRNPLKQDAFFNRQHINTVKLTGKIPLLDNNWWR
jgi:hypothetical protein